MSGAEYLGDHKGEEETAARLETWLQQAEGTSIALCLGRAEALLSELRVDAVRWDAAHASAVCVHLANAVAVSRHGAAQQRADARLLSVSWLGAEAQPSAGSAAREGTGAGLADEVRLRLDLYGREVLPGAAAISRVEAKRRECARQSFGKARDAREWLELPARVSTSDFELRRLVTAAENVARSLAPWSQQPGANLPAAALTPLSPEELNRCVAPLPPSPATFSGLRRQEPAAASAEAPPATPAAAEAPSPSTVKGLSKPADWKARVRAGDEAHDPYRVDWGEHWAAEAETGATSCELPDAAPSFARGKGISSNKQG